jgi:hypothetical protein
MSTRFNEINEKDVDEFNETDEKINMISTDYIIINKQKNTCVLVVLNMICDSFAALTREISCSTLKINLVFPSTHALFSIYGLLSVLYGSPLLNL